MTIKDARIHFENLLAETSNKAKSKLYKEFIYIFNGLEKKNLSDDDIQLIEKKLDGMMLDDSSQDYEDALYLFKKYLKYTFSIGCRLYYSRKTLVLGLMTIVFGLLFLGSVVESLAAFLGMCCAFLITLLIAIAVHHQMKSSHNIL